MKSFKLAVLGIFVLWAGCATAKGPTLTPQAIQSLQTREYEHPKNIVFPSVVSVFQDLGYTIKDADKNTGFLTAEDAYIPPSFWEALSGPYVPQILVTAFVEEIGNITQVRLNFFSLFKEPLHTPILDAEIYQDAFDRIKIAIFIRANN